MRRELLDYLACINCGGNFEISAKPSDAENAHEILEGDLECRGCKAHFPIRHGVPRILPSKLSEEIEKTGYNFGAEWNEFKQPSPIQQTQMQDFLYPLDRQFFKDKVILDFGCGMGRQSIYFAQMGAKAVIGMDVGHAVDQAFRNCKDFPNIHLIQADIFNPPLKRIFDSSIAVGVLHHTPDPKKGFEKMVSVTKPGGQVYAWVYGRENNGWVVKVVSPLRENVTSKLPLPLLRLLSWPLALFLTFIVKGIYGPANRYLPKLSKHLFYYAYLTYLSKFPFREIELIVYDHLTAPIAFYIAKPEFEAWFRENGLKAYEIYWHNQNSWKGFGTVASRN